MAAAYEAAATIPGAADYGQTELQANTAFKNTLARINQRRQESLRQYGYVGNINPDDGTLSGVHVDPMNQYGGLQSMLRNQALGEQQAQFGSEERGLHGGGLANQALSQLKYDEGAQSAQLGQDFTGALSGLQDEQNQAAYTRDSTIVDAQRQAAQQAIQDQQFRAAMEEQQKVLDAYSQQQQQQPDVGGYGVDPISNTPLDAPASASQEVPESELLDAAKQPLVHRAATIVRTASKKAAAHNKKKKGGR